MPSRLLRLLRNRSGATAVEFAFIAPLLITMTLGAIEVALIIFDYHAANEATRRGARQAERDPAVASLANLRSAPIACSSSSGGGVTCSTASVRAAQTFTNVVNEVRAIAPWIGSDNVVVSYRDSGIVVDAAGTIVTPLVTVSLVNVRHDFITLKLIPGMPTSMTYPGFESTRLAASAPAS